MSTTDNESAPPAVALLSKEHDITAFASTDATRYVINSVHFNAKHSCLEATNGRQFIRIPVESSAEFPTISAKTSAPADCIIPLEPFKKALRAIPKSNVPVLENIALTGNCKPETAVLTVNDLDTEQSFTVKLVEGNYPNCDAVIPTEPVKFAIALGATELRKICEYVDKHGLDAGTGGPAITFQFTDDLGAVRWKSKTTGGRDVIGVLMPMRMS